MKRTLAALSAGILLLFLSACAPAVITPRETVTSLPYGDAFSAVVTTINTQPYPATMGGWIITQSDRAGGFVLAEMPYRICGFVPFWHHAEVQCRSYTARVSVTLLERPDGTTAVGIGASNDGEARRLAARIAEVLDLRPTFSPL